MITSRDIWAIALPAMLTNVATALFGIADIWVIGQLGEADPQAGVELGAKFMMGLLVVFNFLRTGTIALTAQAAGRSDDAAQAATLARALGGALVIGLLLLAIMPWAIPAGIAWLGGSGAVAGEAGAYVAIRYPGGAFWLLNAVLVGWLIARRRVRAVLWIEVAANIFHIALDVIFVLGLGWGVEGVAIATLLSEFAKLAAATLIVFREPPAALLRAMIAERATWHRGHLLALLRLNRDLFVRTVLLTFAILMLTRAGAEQGPLVLAANGILYQLFILSALLLDGFESAAQVLCGEAAGAKDRARFKSAVRLNLAWGGALGLALTSFYAVAAQPLATSFSTDPAVIETVRLYAAWAILMPIAGVASYVFDGIYIGATWTRALLLTMIAAFAVFGAALWLAAPLGNHGLWLAFILFLAARGLSQAALMPHLMRRTFG